MTVTVLPILETDFKPEKALAKVMNDRLIRAAKDLQDVHFKPLTGRGGRVMTSLYILAITPSTRFVSVSLTTYQPILNILLLNAAAGWDSSSGRQMQ